MNKDKKIEYRDMPALDRRVAFKPDTLDDEKRTITVEYTAGGRVLRSPFFGEQFYEELSMEPGHVRLGRLNGGAPVLNSHNSHELEDIMGVVESADERFATLKFSERADVAPYYDDIKAGVIRNVSVGYRVHKFINVTNEDDDIPVLRAVDWEPFEISMVAIGADAGAGVRSDEKLNNCTIEGCSGRSNETKIEKGLEMNKDKEAKKVRAEDDSEQRGIAEDKVIAKADNSDEIAEATKQATVKERKRSADIRKAVSAANLDESIAQKMIADGVSVDKAREQIIEQWADNANEPETRATARIIVDENDKRVESMENAMLHRYKPSKFKLHDGGKKFRGLTLMEMARDSLEAKGVDIRGMSKTEVAVRSLQSTSDFPEILANVANKTLRDSYDEVPRTFTAWARQTTLPDFKETSRVALSQSPDLTKVIEGGEYKYGSFSENAEKYRLFTYGKILSITRETIINDDLNAFTRMPALMATAAARLESDLVYAILTGNPNMSDSKTLFHADHNNVTDALFGVGGIGKLDELLMTQKGLGDKGVLGNQLEYLIVPAALKLEALKLQGQINPTQASEVNPYVNAYQTIVEARLDASSTSHYYGAAGANSIDTIEYAYLDGEAGPFIESREGFTRDGLELKIRHDFATKAIDFRGVAKSTNDAA